MPIPHVNPGDPFRPSSVRENAYIDAANAFAANRSRQGPGDVEARRREPLIVWGRNGSADDFPIYGVAELGERIFAPSSDGFFNAVGFEIATPTSAFKPFGILQEPIAGLTATGTFSTAIVKKCVQVGGVTPARILIRSSSHTFARPIVGDKTDLETADAGPARILWKDAGGVDSIVWAYVFLGGGQAEDPDGQLGAREYLVFDETIAPVGELLAAHVVRERIVGRFVNWESFADVWGSQINQGVPLLGRRYLARRSRRLETVDGKAVYLAEECDCSSGSDGSGSSGSDGSSGSSGSGSSGSGSSGVTSCSGACGCGTMPSALELEIGGVVLATFSNTGLCEYTSDLPQFTPSCMVFQTSATFTCHCVSGAPAPILTFSNITGCTPTFALNVVSCSPFRVEGTVDWADAPDEYGCSCDGSTQLVVIREI